MGSSFLTTINVALSLYSVILFVKTIVQFGLPNHPARFIMYLVCLCASAYFTLKALTGIGYVAPVDYLKWRTLPLVAGSLGLLLQVISSIGQASRIQQKIISRIPLIFALLVYAVFPTKADFFFIGCILATVLFLSISVGKARYQKRMILKMSLFLLIFGVLIQAGNYWVYNLGELFLFPALFYFFIFQQSFGVSALVERHVVES